MMAVLWKKWFVIAIALCAILVGACGRNSQAPAIETKARMFTDGLGRTVEIPEKVDSVISLAPNLTEIIFAVGGGKKLVGVTTYCNYPPEAASIRKVSDTLTPNIETIVALKPQVVFVSTASQLEPFTRILTEQKITVFVTAPETLDEIYASISTIGEILGTRGTADSLVASMKARAAKLAGDIPAGIRPKVFVQIDKNSLYTIGKDSFITDLVERAGGDSVTADIATAYPKLSRETALALQPDVIILSESNDNREPNEVFRNSPAVKNGRVYKINADLLSRPGPRVVDALELIAADLRTGPSNAVKIE